MGGWTGKLLRVNLALGEFLGYAPEELVGKSLHEIIHTEENEACSGAPKSTFAGGKRSSSRGRSSTSCSIR